VTDVTDLLIVAAAAFAAPLALGLVPSLRLPAVVLEIVLGIVLGPSVLDWVEVSPPVQLMALLGVAFVLLLAGLELELEHFRGRLLEVTALGFVLSFAIALVLALVLDAGGLVGSPLLIAIIASATSLGIIVPVLKDAGEAETPFGQLVIAGSSIADVATVVLLSLFFSGEASTGLGARLVLLGGFAVLVAAVGVALFEAERSLRLTSALVRLQDTSAQIRVRGTFALLAGFVVLADRLGLEAILGAFVAGAVLNLVDRDHAMTHPEFRRKLEAVGFGVFVPFFFVASGVRFDLDALLASGSKLVLVPIFLVLLLAARGLPAVLYRSTVGTRKAVAAGLLQAVSLGFIVVATEIGMQLGLLDRATGAAFIAAGLLSVLLFPLLAVTVLQPVTAGAHAETVGT
jgi:Kef-type K+ transport system membrane component KefB